MQPVSPWRTQYVITHSVMSWGIQPSRRRLTVSRNETWRGVKEVLWNHEEGATTTKCFHTRRVFEYSNIEGVGLWQRVLEWVLRTGDPEVIMGLLLIDRSLETLQKTCRARFVLYRKNAYKPISSTDVNVTRSRNARTRDKIHKSCWLYHHVAQAWVHNTQTAERSKIFGLAQ